MIHQNLLTLAGQVSVVQENITANIVVKGALKESKPSEDHDSFSDKFKLAVKRVKLPNFDGNDPTRWIARAETYIEVQQVKPEVKVQMDFISMEGAAVH